MWAWRAVTASSVHPDVDAQKCNEQQPGGDNRKLKAQNSVSMMTITNLNSKFFILLFIRSAVRDYEMIRIFIENVHFLWMMLLSASDTILLTALIIE